jgi:hypothetical protein
LSDFSTRKQKILRAKIAPCLKKNYITFIQTL